MAAETGAPRRLTNPVAELARRRYQLRAAVVRGQVDLPVEAAARLIGPDCAYHLYGRLKGRPDPAGPAERETGSG